MGDIKMGGKKLLLIFGRDVLDLLADWDVN